MTAFNQPFSCLQGRNSHSETARIVYNVIRPPPNSHQVGEMYCLYWRHPILTRSGEMYRYRILPPPNSHQFGRYVPYRRFFRPLPNLPQVRRQEPVLAFCNPIFYFFQIFCLEQVGIAAEQGKCTARNSVVDPNSFSGAFWIRIRIPNMDPNPYM